MNVVTTAIGTGAIVMAGRWAEGKGVELKIAIGATTLAIFLSILESANEQFAGQVGLMILIAALFRYIPSFVHGGDFGGTF